MKEKKVVPGTGGERYIPYEERTGGESVVFFTRDLSAEGLTKIYRRIQGALEGKIAVKLHTGEKNGPNIIPREWVRELMEKELAAGTIIETNSYYEGDRDTTEKLKGQRLDLPGSGYHGCGGRCHPACEGRKMVYGNVCGKDAAGI